MPSDKEKSKAVHCINKNLRHGKRIKVFSGTIYLGPSYLDGCIECDPDLLEALGTDFQEWFDKTSELISPILIQQCRELDHILTGMGAKPESLEIDPVPPKYQDFKETEK